MRTLLPVLVVIFLACQPFHALAAPAPPTLSCNTAGLNVTVSWDEVPGATGYTLYYAPYPFAGVHTIGSFDMAKQTGLSLFLWEGAAFFVAATSRDATGESEYSNIELFIFRAPTPEWTDGDADGFIDLDGDCNDTDEKIFPGAVEICGDGIDQDCSGKDKSCDSSNHHQPDLAIKPAVNISNTLSAMPGGKITLPAWTLINQGNAASGDFGSGFYLSTDRVITSADVYLDGNSNSSLAANASFAWDAPTLTVPGNTTAGAYYIGILADNGQRVPESDEGNNSFVLPIRIVETQSQQSIDLVVASKAPSITPAYLPYIVPGETIKISSVTILNNGNNHAGNFSNGVYLSENTLISSTDMLLKEVSWPFGLMSGSQSTVTDIVTRLPSNIIPGNYYIGFMLDKDNSVSEINENNNFIIQDLYIHATKPDLVILSQTLVLTQTTVPRGGFIGVQPWEVSNRGTAPTTSGKFFVGYYLSTDNVITTNDTLLKKIEYPWNLSVNSGYTGFSETLLIPANISPGKYYLGALVDTDNSVGEHDENNNYLTLMITVVP